VLQFNYTAAGSTLNTLGFGFIGNTNLMTLNGAGLLTVSGGISVTNNTLTNLNSTNASVTTLVATNQTVSNLSVTNETVGSMNYINTLGTNLTVSNLIASNATLSNLNISSSLNNLIYAQTTLSSGRGISVFAPGMTVGSNTGMVFGQTNSNLNAAVLQFNYNAPGSTINTLGFGLVGNTNLVTIDGNGLLSSASFSAVNASCNTIVATNAVFTNLTYASLTFANLSVSSLNFANANGSSLSAGNLSAINLSVSNVLFNNISINNLTVNTLVSATQSIGTLNYTNAIGTNLSIGTINASGITVTNLVYGSATSNTVYTNVSSTNLIITNGTTSNLNSTNTTLANANCSNMTINNLSVNSITSSNALALTNTNSNGNVRGLTFLAPNLQNGNNCSVNIGTSLSTNNAATFQFNYVSTGSVLNSFGIGLFGNTNLLTINGNGAVAVPGIITCANLSVLNSTIQNLLATNTSTTNIIATTLSVANLNVTSVTNTNLISTNASVTNLIVATNSSATSLNCTNATCTNLISTNSTFASLVLTNINVNGNLKTYQLSGTSVSTGSFVMNINSTGGYHLRFRGILVETSASTNTSLLTFEAIGVNTSSCVTFNTTETRPTNIYPWNSTITSTGGNTNHIVQFAADIPNRSYTYNMFIDLFYTSSASLSSIVLDGSITNSFTY
jgi:hypothetical protein